MTGPVYDSRNVNGTGHSAGACHPRGPAARPGRLTRRLLAAKRPGAAVRAGPRLDRLLPVKRKGLTGRPRLTATDALDRTRLHTPPRTEEAIAPWKSSLTPCGGDHRTHHFA